MKYLSETYQSGAVTGLLYATIGYPFDTLKVWRQINPKVSYSEMIIRTKNIGRFYNGFSIAGTQITIGYGAVFGTYFKLHQDGYSSAFSSCCAGLAYALIACPMENAKIQYQMKKSFTLQNFSLLRGLGTTIIRDVPATMIQFFTYDLLRNWFMRNTEINKQIQIGASASISGIFFWSLTYPIDLYKTRLQFNAGNVGNVGNVGNMGNVLVRFKGSYAGFVPCLMRTIIVDALGFNLIEFLLDRD